MRKVTIYSTKTKATQTIETDVTTWGALKTLINADMGVNSSKCMVRENRTTLESNEAQLPEGDLTIFLYPEKVKSGVEDVYSGLSSAGLRKVCRQKSLSAGGSDSAMRGRLRSYDRRHGIDSTQEGADRLTKDINVRPTAPAEAPAEVTGEDDVVFPNTVITINELVGYMRNKFNNMFDEMVEQLSKGTVKSEEEILEDEANALASEAGFSLPQEQEETCPEDECDEDYF